MDHANSAKLLTEALRASRSVGEDREIPNPPLLTANCPPLAVLLTAAREGFAFLSGEQRAHLAGSCKSCERALALAWESTCPSAEVLFEYVGGSTLAASALAAHVASCSQTDCVRARRAIAGDFEKNTTVKESRLASLGQLVLSSLANAFGVHLPHELLPMPASSAGLWGVGTETSESEVREGQLPRRDRSLESDDLVRLGFHRVYDYSLAVEDSPRRFLFAVTLHPLVDDPAPVEIELFSTADGAVIATQRLSPEGNAQRATFQRVGPLPLKWSTLAVRVVSIGGE